MNAWSARGNRGPVAIVALENCGACAPDPPPHAYGAGARCESQVRDVVGVGARRVLGALIVTQTSLAHAAWFKVEGSWNWNAYLGSEDGLGDSALDSREDGDGVKLVAPGSSQKRAVPMSRPRMVTPSWAACSRSCGAAAGSAPPS